MDDMNQWHTVHVGKQNRRNVQFVFYNYSYSMYQIYMNGGPPDGAIVFRHIMCYFSTWYLQLAVYKYLYNDSTLLCALQHTKCVERLLTCTQHGPFTSHGCFYQSAGSQMVNKMNVQADAREGLDSIFHFFAWKVGHMLYWCVANFCALVVKFT